jgi:hypothetical protein
MNTKLIKSLVELVKAEEQSRKTARQSMCKRPNGISDADRTSEKLSMIDFTLTRKQRTLRNPGLPRDNPVYHIAKVRKVASESPSARSNNNKSAENTPLSCRSLSRDNIPSGTFAGAFAVEPLDFEKNSNLNHLNSIFLFHFLKKTFGPLHGSGNATVTTRLRNT